MNRPRVRASIRNRIRKLTIVAAALASCLALAPGARSQDASKMEAGVDYNYVHTNAPPGGCGCFSMNGGDGWFSYNFTDSFAGVAQVSAQHASDIGGTTADLTLTSYLFGPRYSFAPAKHFVVFGQLLLGGVHASGALAPGGSGITGSSNAFAMAAGGGLDIVLTRHFAIRAAQVDYYFTHFKNGTTDHQNNLRVAAGVVLRF
jgi:outer membrane immunogenic protein